MTNDNTLTGERIQTVIVAVRFNAFQVVAHLSQNIEMVGRVIFYLRTEMVWRNFELSAVV